MKEEKELKKDKDGGLSQDGALAKIKIADNVPGAEYANAMQVNHTRDEFQFMFFNLFGGTGKVTGKIICSPGHTKRMLIALTDNLKKYEDRFGKIAEAGVDEKEIGFKA